jgi:mRNA-degrading endonuclease toxin of MazEF toxin-antitoxin module
VKSFSQWDVVMFPFTKEKTHPAVIISNDEICRNDDIEEVNALLCTSVRVNRTAKLTEVLLDEADGFDWKTLVRCDRIYLLPKGGFMERKGQISPERRTIVARKVVEAFRLPIYRT